MLKKLENDPDYVKLNKKERLILKLMLQGKISPDDIKSLIYVCDDVDIIEFIENENEIGKGDEIWPSIKEDLWRIYEGGYREVILIEGIGSGKSTLASIALTYEIRKLGRIRNPQRYYSLRTGTKIAVMNMSVRAMQARDVLFDDIKAMVDGSLWFQKYLPADSKIKSRLRFPKNIYAIPGNSTETAPIGFTLKAAALDESAWFMDSSHKGDSLDQSENIYNMLLKRLKSRFHDYLLMVCTSPRIMDDMTEKKRDEAIEDSDLLWIRRPLWKAKPEGYYSNQYFVYDEKYDKIVCQDVRDLVKEAFGFIPDNFETLKIDEIQYILNLILDVEPEIIRPNVIDETAMASEPINLDLTLRHDFVVGSPEGLEVSEDDGNGKYKESIETLEEVPMLSIY